MMRNIAQSPSARGLQDDVAVLEFGGEKLILTHDMMAEGVHWLPHADPADVAWKLVTANLSDLASKGAEPIGLLLGYALSDDEWDLRFANGLQEAVTAFDVPLLGGDTVGSEAGFRAVGMTALGQATCAKVPARSGAQVGDLLYVTGYIGDAKAGFDLENGEAGESAYLRAAFNRPVPLVAQGQALASLVTAMMDVSDGLLIDAQRMASASSLQVTINVNAIPLSDEFIRLQGDNSASKIEAASWGDDYQLLFAMPIGQLPPVAGTCVGYFSDGTGLTLVEDGVAVPTPNKLGFEHG
jgi:thiamine-monophosphate kinase